MSTQRIRPCLLAAMALLAPAIASALSHPILFVTQLPPTQTFESPAEVFFTQSASSIAVPRGGDLWILYPDGSKKNLTAAAGYGVASGHEETPAGTADPKGALGGIAVRNPCVHWSGNKAVFSMVVGSPAHYQVLEYRWQLYEITGLGKDDMPVITKVPNQPANYNNVQPAYLSDGRILFASDRPRGGVDYLYPQRDEYESSPTMTGLYAIDPVSGALQVMTHSVSGDFTPIVAADGRIVFTRWDHLLRDQQADSQLFEGISYHGAFTYADEAQDAVRMPLSGYDEVFPEPRKRAYTLQLYPGKPWNDLVFNSFHPWQINQDGTEVETLNHIGRHEITGSFESSFVDDPALQYFSYQVPMRWNQFYAYLLLQLRQSPTDPNRFYAVNATEFGARAAGQIVALDGLGVGMNPALAKGVEITHHDTLGFNADNEPPRPNDSGKYRNPLPLSDGGLIAAHTSETRTDVSDIVEEPGSPTIFHPSTRYHFRLRQLQNQGGYFVAAGAFLTGSGIHKSLSYFNPDALVQFDDVEMWELDPVEVIARPVPPPTHEATLQGPEQAAFAAAGVGIESFKQWLKAKGLAVLSMRNVTTRDSVDLQQPFNLHVPGGVQTVSAQHPQAKIYDVAWLQIMQADQLRGYGGAQTPDAGRRVLARPLHDAKNLPVAKPAGAVRLGLDGSAAAFVPAGRALAWQLTAPDGEPVVRERVWTSTQPGEVRVCTSCHGINTHDQAGQPAPTNTPQALIDLLQWWRQHDGDALFANGFQTQ